MKSNPTLYCHTNTSLSRFPLLCAFIQIWSECQGAFAQDRTHRRALDLALGLLGAFGRRTITRAICARARQFLDWSADYRFFSKDKWFGVILSQKLLEHLSRHLRADDPLVIAIDDTHKPKSGKKIPASGYFYDSKSPPFARSFKWQLRFLSFSALLTPHGPIAAARGILIRFKLAPTLSKPKKSASEEQKLEYRKFAKLWTIASQLVEQLHLLRAQMDAHIDLAKRLLVVCADSSYVNKTVLRRLPERCILIGRTRKDLKLYQLPDCSNIKGRKRRYGELAPTPEELRQDDSVPYESTTIFAAGKWHNLRYKTMTPLLWKSAGYNLPLRLIVIAPLHYRLRKNSKLLYRRPAYLLVSDTAYPVHLAIQHYFHRWEIEVNHRDAKSVAGVGQAQVRNPRSVSRQFSFVALVWSWLQLASLDAYGPERGASYIPLAKWRNDPRARPSGLDIVSQLRLEMMMYESGSEQIAFQADRDLSPTSSKYAAYAQAWLAQTVPKGLSESLWSSICYADA